MTADGFPSPQLAVIGPGGGKTNLLRFLAAQQLRQRSQWAAIVSISEKFGMTAETLRKWVRRAEVDAGQRPGATSDQLEVTGPR